MPIAIHTKYIGATNTKGSRIKATIRRDSKTLWTASVPFDHALTCEERHALAARALLQKYAPDQLTETLSIAGSTLDNLGYVFTVYPQIQP
jgi:hypothetical protein